MLIKITLTALLCLISNAGYAQLAEGQAVNQNSAAGLQEKNQPATEVKAEESAAAASGQSIRQRREAEENQTAAGANQDLFMGDHN